MLTTSTPTTGFPEQRGVGNLSIWGKRGSVRVAALRNMLHSHQPLESGFRHAYRLGDVVNVGSSETSAFVTRGRGGMGRIAQPSAVGWPTAARQLAHVGRLNVPSSSLETRMTLHSCRPLCASSPLLLTALPPQLEQLIERNSVRWAKLIAAHDAWIFGGHFVSRGRPVMPVDGGDVMRPFCQQGRFRRKVV